MQNHHRLQSMHLTPNATETEEVGQVSSSLHDISDMVSSTISTSNPFVVPFSTRTLNGSFPNKIVNNSAAAFANLLKSTSGPLIATYEANEIKLRLSNLEKKVIAMASNMNRKERTVMSASGFNSISLSGNQVIGALNRAQLPLTPRTVEICSIASFFVVGMVIGRSLFDRLWLVGGVASACWASVAVHRLG